MIATYASPAFAAFLRSFSLRPYTSSNATQRAGSPAAVSRPSWFMASCGLVANSRSSGIPAARRRGRSSGPAPGHVDAEVRPRLPGRGDVGRKHGGHAVFHVAGAPGVLRRHARGGVPLLELV